MKKNSKPADDSTMPLSGHLKELRNRVAVILLVLTIGVLACLSMAPRIVTLLTDMGEKYSYQFVYIAPQELLMVYFSISLLGGVVLAFPVIAYEIYAFCRSGLNRREQAFTLGTLIAGTGFFCLGVAFAYFISLPFMLSFLIQFSLDIPVSASISVEKYVSFLLTVFSVFGIVFELPVASILLTGLGIIRPEWMVKARKFMIVVIFLLAAVITPPDIVSQIMVAIPVVLLYELSILLSRFCYKLKQKKQ